MRRLFITVVAGALLLAACGGGDDVTAGSTAPATSASTAPPATSTTLPPTTTRPATTTRPVSTTLPPTTRPGITTTTTTLACTPLGSLDPVRGGDAVSSTLVGHDIRTGAERCHERVVIELTGTGPFPGYNVAYVGEDVVLGESEETVDLEGDATLEIRFGAWMTDPMGLAPPGTAYDGPTDLHPTNVSAIRELRLVEEWEGVSRWAVGLDGSYPFRVTVLADPPRLVVDLSVPG